MSGLPPTSTPPAGWYPDPGEPSVMRWWDGQQWTHHLQPAPQPDLVSSKPPWLTTRAAIGLVLGFIALATLLFLVLGRGEESTPAPNLSPAEIETADADAQTGARLAQVAIETYATDNGSEYDGATPEGLTQIEPAIPSALEVDATATTYLLTVPSEGGTRFSLSRGIDGVISFSCDAPGEGGCPDTGNWESE